MKGHKGRKHRETGGVNEAEEDLKRKNPSRTGPGDAKNVHEAEETAEADYDDRKRGGRAKRRAGGAVAGAAGAANAGRKPRKSGGRASCESNPFSSAKHGTAPKGRKVEME